MRFCKGHILGAVLGDGKRKSQQIAFSGIELIDSALNT
jgi:hypothetical protein